MTDRNKAYLKIISAYDSSIRKLYDQMIEDLSKLAKSSYTLDADGKGVQFTFSSHKKTRDAAEKIIEKYTELITAKINAGIQQAVNASYNAEILRLNALKVDGGKLLTQQRETAVAAFNEYRVKGSDGLSLSDRVWNYASQTKSEFEMAMSQKLEDGIRRGASAEEIGRQVKSMLRNPDAVYRRYHLKVTSPDGTKKDKVEWRKRTVDENGKVHYTSTDIEKTGRGVYRSARQNAVRLAATEINMAYRYADFQRWQNAPYVTGYEVRLSNNHPVEDICDDLKGTYPKDFCFVGWHPRCRCTVIAVTVPYEEMRKMSKLPEKEYRSYKPQGLITKMPNNFNKWLDKNKGRALASIERGKPPYFIRDNAKRVNKLLGIEEPIKSIKEIAAERHAARTPEQVAMLRDYWQKKVEQGNIRRKQESEKRAIVRYGSRIARYMSGISDVDISALQKAVQQQDTAKIRLVAENLKAIGKRILSLHRLDNPMKVARDYSMADAVAVNKAVEARLAKESTELAARESFLKTEIQWVEDHKKYATWKVAQDAYKKELRIVQRKIDVKAVADSVASAIGYAQTSKSKVFKRLASEMRGLLSDANVDLTVAGKKARELNNKYQQVKAKELNKASKTSVTTVKPQTLDELKQQLGSSLPRTLENLDKAIARYEQTGKYGSIEKTNKKEIETVMKRVFNEHDFGMNIKESLLKSVLNSWFKNTFEVGSSGGYVGSHKTTGKIETYHARLKAAHSLFGLKSDNLAVDQLPRRAYEKYGSLLDHNIVASINDNPAVQYGNIEVRFKKDKVIATWTAGDSLGKRFQPSLVSDPKSCSFDNLHYPPTSVAEQVQDLAKFRADHTDYSYIEMQYHGDLTVDCVDSITFPYDIKAPAKAHFLAVAKKWKATGAKIYYIVNNTLYQL